jgi:hypothetical protein
LYLTLVLTALALALPGTALAQTASIAGEVTDETGGVLPGVTVTATDDAAGAPRTVVTDGQGLYTITALAAPGTYVVEFTLPGFSTVRREGVELATGFTANIDAQMAVGGVEETVTVTGATPTVDIQNVSTSNVLDRDVLDALPNSQNISSFAALTLGVTITGASGIGGQDVGGTGGEMGIASINNNRGTDQKMTQDGMNVNNAMGTNGGIFRAGMQFNMEGVAEVAIGHTGMNAETETAGVNMNYIPKEGGNQFSASGRATYTNEDFQSDNLGDLDQRNATLGSMKQVYDYGGSFGGPIVQDKLWFFTAHRWWGDEVFSPNSFDNAIHGQNAANGVPLYAPDMGKRGFIQNYNQENSGRVTWQASPKDKIAYFGNYNDNCVCFRGVQAILTPNASFNNFLPQNHLSQVTYTRAHSNSILIEAGFSYLRNPFGFGREGTAADFDDVSVVAVAGGATTAGAGLLIYNAKGSAGLPYNDGDGPGSGLSEAGQQNARGALSYVTGSHSFKVGFTWAHGLVEANGESNHIPGFGPGQLTTIGGAPFSISAYSQPFFNQSDFHNTGIYAQDQWTLDRFTINAGVRFDMFDGYTNGATVMPSHFTPGFSFDKISDAPTYRDVSPRLGVAWDVRGDGRTAFKASAGRYVAAKGVGNSQPFNPARAISTTTTRFWFDGGCTDRADCVAGDFIVQGDGSDPNPNGELGISTNPSFGQAVIVNSFNDDFATKNRSYTWQYSVSVDQELQDNVRVTLAYNRTAHYNQSVVDNLLVTSADYQNFCVTPTSGPAQGQQLCEFWDRTPEANSRFAEGFQQTRIEDTFGDRTETYNGFSIETQARFDNGALAQGGVIFGETVNNNCFTVDSPERQNYLCEVVSPWWDQGGQIKFAGLYPLPYGVELSAVYQNLPGIEIRAQERVLGNDPAIVAQLGRNATRGTNFLVDTVQRNNDFEDRLNQVDFRVAKSFAGDWGRVLVTLDLYNALNANTIRNRVNELGGSYGDVIAFMGARTVKLGGQFSWN